VRSVIFFCVGMASLDLLLGLEHWPFSNYAMYSHAENYLNLPTEAYLFYGVTDREGLHERRLEDSDVKPFYLGRLAHSVKAIIHKHDDQPGPYLDEVLEGVLIRYQKREQAGQPKLYAIRLYRGRWDRYDLATLHRDHPDFRALVWTYIRRSDQP
jgi:hypothetical protein